MQSIESLEAKLQQKQEESFQLVKDHNFIWKMHKLLSWEGICHTQDPYMKVLRLTCPAGLIKMQRRRYSISDRYKITLNNEEVFSAKTASRSTNIGSVDTLRQKGLWFRWVLGYYTKAKTAHEQKHRMKRIQELEGELKKFD